MHEEYGRCLALAFDALDPVKELEQDAASKDGAGEDALAKMALGMLISGGVPTMGSIISGILSAESGSSPSNAERSALQLEAQKADKAFVAQLAGADYVARIPDAEHNQA